MGRAPVTRGRSNHAAAQTRSRFAAYGARRYEQQAGYVGARPRTREGTCGKCAAAALGPQVWFTQDRKMQCEGLGACYCSALYFETKHNGTEKCTSGSVARAGPEVWQWPAAGGQKGPELTEPARRPATGRVLGLPARGGAGRAGTRKALNGRVAQRQRLAKGGESATATVHPGKWRRWVYKCVNLNADVHKVERLNQYFRHMCFVNTRNCHGLHDTSSRAHQQILHCAAYP